MLLLLLYLFCPCLASNVTEDTIPLRPLTIVKPGSTSGQLPPGGIDIYRASLTKHDSLDLFRLRVQIQNQKAIEKDVDLLTITASNGRHTVEFSLPERDKNGSLIYESTRLMQPLRDEDFDKGSSLPLSVTVSGRSRSLVKYEIFVKRYDRAQYLVDLPSKPRSLSNQELSPLIPKAYRVHLKQDSPFSLHVSSDDDICGRLVVLDDESHLYTSLDAPSTSLFRATFTRRLDKDFEPVSSDRVMNVYFLVAPGMCGEGDPLTVHKRFNISFSSPSAPSLTPPLLSFAATFLIAPAMLFAAAAVARLRSSKLFSTHSEDASPDLIDWESSSRNVAYHQEVSSDPLAIFEERREEEGDRASSSPESVATVETERVTDSPDRQLLLGGVETKTWSLSDLVPMAILLPLLLKTLDPAVASTDPRDGDSCFHNYGCARDIWGWRAGNRIVSNMGYAINGVVFLVFTWMRRGRRLASLGPRPDPFLETMMGATLICTAVGSSAYHVCPRRESFHFDTSFILSLLLLCFLRLSSSRLLSLSPVRVASVIAAVVGVDQAVQMLDSFPSFRLLLPVLHLSTLAGGVYYTRTKADRDDPHPVRRVASHPSVQLLITSNLALATAYYFGWRDALPANDLVLIFAVFNTLFYTGQYIVNKLVCHEPLTGLPLYSLALSVVAWTGAVYAFTRRESDWTMTPAHSRALNSECVVMGVWDWHDVWHWASAMAALFSLITVSTLDDAVHSIPREELIVF